MCKVCVERPTVRTEDQHDVLSENFSKPRPVSYTHLGIDNAPGQEALQKKEALDLRGEKLLGARVDFSHGDVAVSYTHLFLFLLCHLFCHGKQLLRAHTLFKCKQAVADVLLFPCHCGRGHDLDFIASVGHVQLSFLLELLLLLCCLLYTSSVCT